jgi:hypothetical protein
MYVLIYKFVGVLMIEIFLDEIVMRNENLNCDSIFFILKVKLIVSKKKLTS